MSNCLSSCPMDVIYEYSDDEFIDSYTLYACNNCGKLVKYTSTKGLLIDADNTLEMTDL